MKKTILELLERKEIIDRELNTLTFDKYSVERRIVLFKEIYSIRALLNLYSDEEIKRATSIEIFRQKIRHDLIDEPEEEEETEPELLPAFLLGYAIGKGDFMAFLKLTTSFYLLKSVKGYTRQK
jgi:hypothetical protein